MPTSAIGRVKTSQSIRRENTQGQTKIVMASGQDVFPYLFSASADSRPA